MVLMNLFMIVSSSLFLQKQRQYGQSARPASSPRRNRASFDPARRTTALTFTLVLSAHVSGALPSATIHLQTNHPPTASVPFLTAPQPYPFKHTQKNKSTTQRKWIHRVDSFHAQRSD